MVDVVRAVLPETGKIGPLEQCEGLQQDRSLAPCPAGDDFEISEATALRWTDRRAVIGEIFGREEPAFLLHEGDDLTGDVAAVEGIACRFEAGFAAAGGRRALLVGHVLQRRCKVGLAEHLARFGQPPVGQKDRRSRRPSAMICLVPLQARGHQ